MVCPRQRVYPILHEIAWHSDRHILGFHRAPFARRAFGQAHLGYKSSETHALCLAVLERIAYRCLYARFGGTGRVRRPRQDLLTSQAPPSAARPKSFFQIARLSAFGRCLRYAK